MRKSWILKGLFLGLVFYIAMLIQKPIGVSTQFSIATGSIQKVFDSKLIYENKDNKYGYGSTNPYYDSNGGLLAKEIEKPFNYEMTFIVGMLLGTSIISLMAPKERENIVRNARKEGNFIVVHLKLFFGGFLLLFGGRLAGGCTSGHMMSGMIQTSLSSFLFTICLFPIAIFVANEWGD
ncbi:MAG: YeeE/YedE thiosulfate transporter family protein [Fusobacteriaceae bacterium]